MAGKGCLGCAGLFGVLAIISLILQLFGIKPPPPSTSKAISRKPPSGSAEQSLPLTNSSPIEPAAHVVPYRIVASFRMMGQRWKDVLITGHPTDSELIALAQVLHRKFPDTRFALFNNASEIANCNWNDVHYREAPRGCSNEWLYQHDYGLINRMGTDSGVRWAYVGGNVMTNLGTVPLE